MTDDKVKILIVDDLPANIHAMEVTLQALDVEIHTALSGNDALDKMTRNDYAVVLMDVQMPLMDGFETAELMQHKKATKDIPIIFVTAISKEDQHVFKGYEAGAVDYLFKPLNRDILLSKVQVFINLYISKIECKRLAEEANKIKNLESLGVLAGGIAHDFNNLLTAIFVNIEMAKMLSEPDSQVRQTLAQSGKALNRATDLTKKLLTFSKGGGPVKQTTQIDQLINETCTLFVSGSNCKLVIDIPSTTQAVQIDTGQINQVLQNLIQNAKEAMPDGGIIKVVAENLEISSTTSPIQPGKYVKITVSDNGPGIPSNIIDKIFDPYFSTKEMGSNKGQGLGLAASNSIVMKHNGYIDVESEIGTGSSFIVYLPAVNGTSTSKPTNSVEAESKIIQQEPPINNVSKGKILIMDDEEIIREVSKGMLVEFGYEVLLAEDGKEAIEIFDKEEQSSTPIDVVVMDLTIPGGMGGKKAVKDVLKINPKAKVVATSGYTNDPVITNFIEFGFSASIIKPFKMDSFMEIIDNLINNKG